MKIFFLYIWLKHFKAQFLISHYIFYMTMLVFFYISKKLHEHNTAKGLLNRINSKIQLLKIYPNMYAKLKDKHKLDKIHRKVTIGNYIMIYTVDEDKLQVNISHIYYQGENYLDKM